MCDPRLVTPARLALSNFKSLCAGLENRVDGRSSYCCVSRFLKRLGYVRRHPKGLTFFRAMARLRSQLFEEHDSKVTVGGSARRGGDAFDPSNSRRAC